MFNLELVINSLTQLKCNECQMWASLDARIPENHQDCFISSIAYLVLEKEKQKTLIFMWC